MRDHALRTGRLGLELRVPAALGMACLPAPGGRRIHGVVPRAGPKLLAGVGDRRECAGVVLFQVTTMGCHLEPGNLFIFKVILIV